MANEARFEVYPRKRKMVQRERGSVALEPEPQQFGWRFRAANGQITAVGGEGFTRREDAHRAAKSAVGDMRASTQEAKLAKCKSCGEAIIYDAPSEAPPILDVDE